MGGKLHPPGALHRAAFLKLCTAEFPGSAKDIKNYERRKFVMAEEFYFKC